MLTHYDNQSQKHGRNTINNFFTGVRERNRLTGIRDITFGQIAGLAVDPTTGYLNVFHRGELSLAGPSVMYPEIYFYVHLALQKDWYFHPSIVREMADEAL